MRTRTRTALAALPLALTLILTGCGSDDGGDGAASVAADDNAAGAGSDNSADSPEDFGLAFAQCMRDQGLDYPDPQQGGLVQQLGPDELGVDDQTYQTALAACQDHLPQPGGGEPLPAEDLDALRDFAQCMRDAGIDLPDPTPEGRLSVPDDVDVRSDKFQTAMPACQDLLGGAKFSITGGDGQ